MIYIDSKQCTACGACVEICPTGALQWVKDQDGRHVEIDREICRECEACVEACPEEAIWVEMEPVVEGELVPAAPGAVQVKADRQEIQPAQPASPALSWLGAALAFVGREIVPRMAVSLLEAWDRRHSSATAMPRTSDTQAFGRSMRQGPATGRGGGQRHRRRKGQGRG